MRLERDILDIEVEMSQTFTEAQVIAGVQLIQAWYEGIAIDAVDPKEFLNAVRIAARDLVPNENTHSVDWTGCCC
jgi:ABC-type sugar transport system substrate-binding protein